MFDAVIIGAGASGFCCAAALLQQGKSVAILEHNDKPLKKVAISGGGRCNFTNINAEYKNYVSENNKFCISALKQFSPQKFINILNKHRIGYYEKKDGQMFAKDSSSAIIEMLIKEAKGAKIVYGIEIKDIKKEENFIIASSKGVFEAKNLIVATGGMSYPQIGAGDLGYKIAKQFGLKIVPYKPALVPFNLDNELMKKIIKLKGVSLPAKVKTNNFETEENILFTHFGISGPAVLQASLYWGKGDEISINLLPQTDVFELLLSAKNNSKAKKISNILSQYLPARVVEFVLGEDDVFVTEASNKLLRKIADNINNWKFIPIGTQGFKLAEVTFGGVSVDEISSKTFEAQKVSGLFFIGEVLDVAGQLGGYNLQWAWSSGFAAGSYIGEK